MLQVVGNHSNCRGILEYHIFEVVRRDMTSRQVSMAAGEVHRLLQHVQVFFCNAEVKGDIVLSIPVINSLQ